MRQLGTGMPELWAPGRRDRRLKENKQSDRVTKCTSDGGHTWEADVGGAVIAERLNWDKQCFYCICLGGDVFVFLRWPSVSLGTTTLQTFLPWICLHYDIHLNCLFTITAFKFKAGKSLKTPPLVEEISGKSLSGCSWIFLGSQNCMANLPPCTAETQSTLKEKPF